MSRARQLGVILARPPITVPVHAIGPEPGIVRNPTTGVITLLNPPATPPPAAPIAPIIPPATITAPAAAVPPATGPITIAGIPIGWILAGGIVAVVMLKKKGGR